jgi:stage II sporulation protein M
MRLYREEWEAWRAHYRRYFKLAARALALGFILGFVYFMVRPAQEKKALAFVMKSLKDIPLGASPLVLALTLFYHNARASVIAVAAGAVPLACLPVLDPLANGATLGLLASISKHQGLNVPLLFLKSVAPHGIFELPAVLYATSVGIYLSLTLGKLAGEAWRKRGGREPQGPEAPPSAEGFLESHAVRPDDDTGDLAGKVVRSFGLVVLPLLLVAAVIEAFITPSLR